MRISRIAAAIAPLLIGLGAFCQTAVPVVTVDNGTNTPEQQQKHYVVLVSLDGFRVAYVKQYGAPHLEAIGKEGATAPDGMIPSYPSLTFPNHYTLVTGLYPEHHGIVANGFYDPARKESYWLGDAKAVQDGSWYGGVPLWSLAEQQGMRSACFFWPGSEAEIAGKRPSYYLHFDGKIPFDQRVDQVIAWLQLPPEKRPHFLTLYLQDPDHEGHEFGPNSLEAKDAVHHVDDVIGVLKAKLDALHLPIDLIVVADHGMEETRGSWITLDKYASLTNFETAGPLLYPHSEADAAQAYRKLRAADADFRVYRRAQMPAELHYNSNPREGDPVIVPEGPVAIRAHGPAGDKPDKAPPKGEHGYNPYEMPSMRAIFFASGPDIEPGVQLKPFENVNLYPLIARLLGLNAPKVDGSLNVLSPILVPALSEGQQ
ncbi:alkaline phosphatase family protein [Silvibacterium acidisoli]|uniref:alkaline phosphatase family protein n=1 Tax=Acidobacteriaceae bacterium ZG23-2 TaxID=2883246 RepID=UPI00406C8A6F